MTCRSLAEVRHWAELGNQEPLPVDLHAHATRCDNCAEFVQTVATARELGAQLPATPMGPVRHDAVKFGLMAAARQGANMPARGNRRMHLGVRLLLAAIVLSATAAASKYIVQNMRKSPMIVGSNASNAARSLSHLDAYQLSASLDRRLSTVASELRKRSPPVALQSGQNPTTSTSTPWSGDASTASNLDGDARFADAWAALRSKRPAQAAKHFDELLSSGSLDAARRADILYWSSQAHRQAGHAGAAQNRSAQLLRQYPSSPFASDAALILGEYALASDRFDAAVQYLNKAAASDRPVVRERAKRALRELVQKDAR